MAKTIEKQDLRLLIHLMAKVCKNDFGSDSFHRNFICLDNLKKLARVQSLDYVTSWDIRQLIEGLCKLTATKQQVSFGFAEKEETLLYCSSLNLVIMTLLKDVEKLERSKQLRLDDFTKIIRAVSSAPVYQHLILLDSWKDFLILHSAKMSLANIEDIEIALAKLDFRDPALLTCLHDRRMAILDKDEEDKIKGQAKAASAKV